MFDYPLPSLVGEDEECDELECAAAGALRGVCALQQSELVRGSLCLRYQSPQRSLPAVPASSQPAQAARHAHLLPDPPAGATRED